MSLDEEIRKMVTEIVAEHLAERPQPRQPTVGLDDQARESIRQLEIVAHMPYLTKRDLAIYLNCSERAIEEWAARPAHLNPLPVARAGRELRIKRERVDEWTEREGRRFSGLKQVS